MKRRSRLSRSRDFDAVYRHGRSVSSRYLVLYTFARPADADPDGPRLGLAVSRKTGGAVDRNQVKRRLREAFERLTGEVDAAHDYVLIARPGLAEAISAQGFEWLLGQVRDVFAQAKAIEGTGR